MKKRNNIKIIGFILMLVLLVLGVYVANKYEIPPRTGEFDFNYVIALFTLVFVIANEKMKIFDSLFLSLGLIVLIVIQTLLIIANYFYDLDYLKNASDLSSFMIIIIIIIYMIKRMLKNQVSTDIKLLEIVINRKIKKYKKGNNKVDILEDLRKWINSNKIDNSKQNDIKTIIKLLEKTIEQVMVSDYSLNGDNKNEITNDQFIKELKKLYLSLIGIPKLEKEFVALLLKIVKKGISVCNRLMAERYIHFLCIVIHEIECSNRKKQSLLASKLYCDYIVNNIEDIDVDMLSLLNDGLEFLRIEYLKYDFLIDEKEYIYFMQDYVDAKNCIFKKSKNEYSVHELSVIVDMLKSRTKKDNDINLFEKRTIIEVSKYMDDIDVEINTLKRIIDIKLVKYENTDECLWIIAYLAELIKDNDKYNTETIKDLLSYASLLEHKDKVIINMNNILDIILCYDREKLDEFFEKTRKVLLFDKANYEFLLKCLDKKIDENNIDECLVLFDSLIKHTLIIRTNPDVRYFLIVINKLTDTVLKKYSVSNTKKMQELIDEIYVHLNDLLDEYSDDFVSKKLLLDYVNGNLKNGLLEENSVKTLERISFKSIDGFDKEVAKVVSNYLGWYLFENIKNKDNKSTSILKHCIKFFELTCEYLDKETAIFVGTIFVVNLTYLKMLKEKGDLFAVAFNSETNKIKSLKDKHKLILNDSFTIRKELIYDFMEKNDEKESIRKCNECQIEYCASTFG